jgi:hypothetical protein
MADSDSHTNWPRVTKLALSIVGVAGIVIVPRLPHGVVVWTSQLAPSKKIRVGAP